MIWILIPAALVLVFLGMLFVIYRMSFYYRDPCNAAHIYQPNGQGLTMRSTKLPLIFDFDAAAYEAVSIQSRDGLTLTGRYYHQADGAPLLLQMHGYKGNAIRDFCGAWPVAREMKCNVLLVNQRCHSGSQGHSITFGIKEHSDCLAWAEYAARRFANAPIFLMGVSMGAATVLMAAQLDLPPNVKGIIADCPYDTPANIIRKVITKEIGLPAKLLYPPVRLSARLFGGFDLEKCSPLEAVQKSKLPILLIHGEEDRLVPCDMSRRLYAAAPNIVQLCTVPGAGHALNQITDPALYRRTLLAFIQNILQAAKD